MSASNLSGGTRPSAAVASAESRNDAVPPSSKEIDRERGVAAGRQAFGDRSSLRDLARRAGVSHAAPAHHFGDKVGLLTAVATDGYRRLADALRTAYEATGSFLEVGVAYVRFALEHRPHFEVMFRPELYDPDDPDLVTAKAGARALLYGPLGSVSGADPSFDTLRAGVAAWSLVHGLATLWLNGNLPPELGGDPEGVARSVAAYLFQPAPGTRPCTRRAGKGSQKRRPGG